MEAGLSYNSSQPGPDHIHCTYTFNSASLVVVCYHSCTQSGYKFPVAALQEVDDIKTDDNKVQI